MWLCVCVQYSSVHACVHKVNNHSLSLSPFIGYFPNLSEMPGSGHCPIIFCWMPPVSCCLAEQAFLPLFTQGHNSFPVWCSKWVPHVFIARHAPLDSYRSAARNQILCSFVSLFLHIILLPLMFYFSTTSPTVPDAVSPHYIIFLTFFHS